MIKYSFYLFILVGPLTAAKNWESHSANLLPKQRLEIGLFQPLRYGVSEKLEISSHPLVFFVMPNISVKTPHGNIGGWSTASRHRLLYPTPLLNMFSKGIKIGGNTASLISPNFVIPIMLGVSNDLLLTKSTSLADITFRGGIDLGFVFGDLDERSLIDLPLLYHRLGVYYNTWGLDFGIDIYRKLTEKFWVHTDIDLLLLPGFSGSYNVEHKLLLIWKKSEKIRFSTGYKFIYGEFPYGNEARVLPYFPLIESWIPMFEIEFSRSLKQ